MKINHEHKGLIAKWAMQIKKSAIDLHFEDIVYEVITELHLLEPDWDPERGKLTTIAEYRIRQRRPYIIARLRGTDRPYYWHAGRKAHVKTAEYRHKRERLTGHHCHIVDPRPGPLDQLIEKEEREHAQRVAACLKAERGSLIADVLEHAPDHATDRKNDMGLTRYLEGRGGESLRYKYTRQKQKLQRLLTDIDLAAAEILEQLRIKEIA